MCVRHVSGKRIRHVAENVGWDAGLDGFARTSHRREQSPERHIGCRAERGGKYRGGAPHRRASGRSLVLEAARLHSLCPQGREPDRHCRVADTH